MIDRSDKFILLNNRCSN